MATAVADLVNTFDNHWLHQLSYHTILNELRRFKLAWHDKSGTPQEWDVPTWYDEFIVDATRSLLVTGVAYYTTKRVQGHVIVKVADPTLVTPCYDEAKARVTYKQNDDKATAKWSTLVLEAPMYTFASKSLSLRSGSQRASQLTERLDKIDAHWAMRDARNSVPSVYTTVSDKLVTQNGSDKMWFKSVNTADVVHTRANDIDSNFSNLVTQRAETIRNLDSITSMARTSKRAKLGSAPSADPEPVDHDEHVISDGRTFSEQRHLLGPPDVLATREGVVSSIMFSFGVPPQVIGKNINSERLASSNRLTEMAVIGFRSLITRLRKLLASVIASVSTTPKGRYVDFITVLHTYELTELLPVLTDDAAFFMTARAYNIDAAMIDRDKLREQHAVDTIRGGGVRPRTASEAVAADRQKNNAPRA
ncbi:MAG: hypothetical protein VW491_01270 [Gammaproteobacteria bacterium]